MPAGNVPMSSDKGIARQLFMKVPLRNQIKIDVNFTKERRKGRGMREERKEIKRERFALSLLLFALEGGEIRVGLKRKRASFLSFSDFPELQIIFLLCSFPISPSISPNPQMFPSRKNYP